MMHRPILAAVDQLVFLVLVVAAWIFKALASRGSGDKPAPPSRPSTQVPRRQTPLERAPEQTDADRIRKFLEALGQPQGSNPPPRVQPRPTPPPPVYTPPPAPPPERPRRAVLNRLPPLTTAPPPLPEQPEAVYPRATPRRQVTPAPRPAAAPAGAAAYEAQEAALRQTFENSSDKYSVVTRGAAVSPPGTASLASLLSTPEGLRRAMILREIFGPPRSLQPLEDLTAGG